MPSSELVSALVPAHNHAEYVREALEALARQTHRPLELLVGDDASSDETASAIRAFLRERGDVFDRVVFEERRENIGVAAMLNALVAQARGTYVFVNASDDRAEPHAISVLAGTLDADPRAAMAVGDNILIDDSSRRMYWGPHRETLADPADAAYLTWVEYLRAVNRPGVFDEALFGRPGTLHRVNYIPNGKLFRRTAVEGVGGWRSGVLEDWDMNFRLALRHRLRYVDEVLYAYRWHATNTIRDPRRLEVLYAATQNAIARELRHPLNSLRVLAHRDLREGLRVRMRHRAPQHPD